MPKKRSDRDGSFYPHLTLKVLPPDAQTIEVTQDIISRHLSISKYLLIALILWTDITSQEEIETLLLECNKQHLQQTAREEGLSTEPLSLLYAETTASI